MEPLCQESVGKVSSLRRRSPYLSVRLQIYHSEIPGELSDQLSQGTLGSIQHVCLVPFHMKPHSREKAAGHLLVGINDPCRSTDQGQAAGLSVLPTLWSPRPVQD